LDVSLLNSVSNFYEYNYDDFAIPSVFNTDNSKELIFKYTVCPGYYTITHKTGGGLKVSDYSWSELEIIGPIDTSLDLTQCTPPVSQPSRVLTPVISGTNDIYSEQIFFPFEGIYYLKFTLPNRCDDTLLFEIPDTNNCTSLAADVCDECIGTFALKKGEQYSISAWVHEESYKSDSTRYFAAPQIIVYFCNGTSCIYNTFICDTSSAIIDGWQQINGTFSTPSAGDVQMKIVLKNSGTSSILFDDIRIHPHDASLKSYVYDVTTGNLNAVLDERNFSTQYEYDEEGNLTRIKKETERGVQTLQETKSNYAN
jgi:YD repeat-containing protein